MQHSAENIWSSAQEHLRSKLSADTYNMWFASLRASAIDRLIITGCATDYCVDTTVRSALARSYPTTVPSDGHTTSDRPHLPATKIIEHHNAIWSDFLAPRGPALICACSEVRLA